MATGVQDNTKTGNPYIDPLLSGWKWDGGPVTYGFAQTLASFPDTYSYYEPENHFAPVNEMMRQNLQAILKGETPEAGSSMVLTPVTGFTNITFQKTNPETTPTDIRIGMSSYPSYAMAYVPGEYNSYGGSDGDIWFGRGHGAVQIMHPVNGSYGHYTNLWAVGKSLGLQHGWLEIPDDMDFKEYTVMTYNHAPVVEVPGMGPKAVAGGRPEIQNLDFNYSQTFMMLDIAALQHMYGANYNFRSGDNVYTWDSATGETFIDGVSKGLMGDRLASGTELNKIFLTIWDGGGNDTYDLSNYSTDLQLNLEPGQYSTFSTAQRVYIDWYEFTGESYYARGNVYNSLLFNDDPRSLIENAKGGVGNDHLTGNKAANHLWGNDGKDTLAGSAGNDVLDGGAGTDTAVFSGAKANYTITKNADGSFTIVDTRKNGDGQDSLFSVNFAQFSDQTVTLEQPPADPSDYPPVVYYGTSRANFASGGKGNDQLFGNGGNDRLNGRGGNDYLVGGSGKDSFIFDTALGSAATNRQVNFDTIADFKVKDDTIRLDNAVFRKLGKKTGTLNKEFFIIGTKAKEKDDYLVYNKKTGVLAYDPDGSGRQAAIDFVQLSKNLKLKYNDFQVI